MKDDLAHMRHMFARDRVVAGATQFYAISRYNLAIGPVRESLDDAESDADRFHAINERLTPGLIGWGACL
jgi:hypothetical protein